MSKLVDDTKLFWVVKSSSGTIQIEGGKMAGALQCNGVERGRPWGWTSQAEGWSAAVGQILTTFSRLVRPDPATWICARGANWDLFPYPNIPLPQGKLQQPPRLH